MSPFDVLEETVRRQDLQERAAKVLSDTRARLILGNKVGSGPTEPGLTPGERQKKAIAASVFFGTLAMKLKTEACWEIPTACTDGHTLLYNPEFLVGLPKDEAAGVLVHEIMHPAQMHHVRRGQRDAKRWNRACDLSINPMIREAGFKLPPGSLFPGVGPDAHLPVGLAAEEYYTLLSDDGEQKGEEPSDGEGGQGDSDLPPDPGGCGGVTEPGDGDSSTKKASEADWKVALAQAETVAKQCGGLSAGLARMVGETLAPSVNWREVLREFVSRWAKNDFTWSPCNRKLISQGLYLPSMRSEELGDVIVALDTSGSIGPKELQVFGSELQGILENFDCSLTVLYHDDAVTHVQTWKSADGPLVLEARGGGGTSHVCIFEWIEEHGCDESPCLVCLTDLYTSFPGKAPEIPVLWAVVGNSNPRAPFGQIVEVKG